MVMLIKETSLPEIFLLLDLIETDRVEGMETLVNTLYIDGDDDILTLDEYFIGCSMELESSIFTTHSVFIETDEKTFTFSIENGENVYKAVFRSINRKEFFTLQTIKNSYQLFDYIFENCKISVDDEINTNMEYKRSIMLNLSTILKFKDAVLKKN